MGNFIAADGVDLLSRQIVQRHSVIGGSRLADIGAVHLSVLGPELQQGCRGIRIQSHQRSDISNHFFGILAQIGLENFQLAVVRNGLRFLAPFRLALPPALRNRHFFAFQLIRPCRYVRTHRRGRVAVDVEKPSIRKQRTDRGDRPHLRHVRGLVDPHQRFRPRSGAIGLVHTLGDRAQKGRLGAGGAHDGIGVQIIVTDRQNRRIQQINKMPLWPVIGKARQL